MAEKFRLIRNEERLTAEQLAAKGDPDRTERLRRTADSARADRKYRISTMTGSPTKTGWDKKDVQPLRKRTTFSLRKTR